MSDRPQRVMVCSPHPDDAEIGASGTIAKWVSTGTQVLYVICTNGDKGSSDPKMTSPKLAAIRKKEQTKAAKTLGVQEVVFLDHGDGELEDTREFRGELVREIRRFKPDAVMTVDPFRKSFYMHRDHRMTGQVTLDAVFPYARDHLHFPEHKALGLEPHKVGEVYLWGTETPDHYEDISDTIDLKAKATKCHVSQFSRPDRDIGEFIRDHAKNNGKKKGMEFAEAFRLIQLRR